MVPGIYLSAAELKSNLQEIGASDAVLLFDTCNSGAFLDELDSSDTRARQSADEGKQELEKIINGPESTEFMLMGAAAAGRLTTCSLATMDSLLRLYCSVCGMLSMQQTPCCKLARRR